jgi:signal transduction histidine kinase
MTGEDLRSAYDRFYRGSAAEGIEGTGLGLAIARKSVERAGGTMLICNRSGGGLLCTIRLPAASGADVRALQSDRA